MSWAWTNIGPVGMPRRTAFRASSTPIPVARPHNRRESQLSLARFEIRSKPRFTNMNKDQLHVFTPKLWSCVHSGHALRTTPIHLSCNMACPSNPYKARRRLVEVLGRQRFSQGPPGEHSSGITTKGSEAACGGVSTPDPEIVNVRQTAATWGSLESIWWSMVVCWGLEVATSACLCRTNCVSAGLSWDESGFCCEFPGRKCILPIKWQKTGLSGKLEFLLTFNPPQREFFHASAR